MEESYRAVFTAGRAPSFLTPAFQETPIMRLFSYRGVAYTIAPPSVFSKLNPVKHSSAEPSLETDPEQIIEHDVFTPLPQPQTPTAAIPMMYRGVLYLLERYPHPPMKH